nr:MAG TPA: hypothetical protein [Caudoviricetes sp.]
MGGRGSGHLRQRTSRARGRRGRPLSPDLPGPRGFSMFTASSMGEGVAWPPYNLHI